MHLPIETRFLRMRFDGPGRRLPWLGPALRGTVARQVKDRVCRWPPAEREAKWRYCRNCPHQAECPYGATFEPDPPAGWTLSRGQADGQRAISLAPRFPVDEVRREDEAVEVRMTLLGRRAIDAAGAVMTVLTDRHCRFALGTDRAVFRFEEATPEPQLAGIRNLSLEDLSVSASPDAGRIPRLQLDLVSPLFLKEGAGPREKSRPVFAPILSQLARASLRVVGRAFAMFGDGALEDHVDFAALKTAAESVPTEAAYWQRFRQSHYSNRRLQRYDLVGIIGGALFADVPVSLLPWLVWGGRLGVGEHRVAGAGCWHLVLS